MKKLLLLFVLFSLFSCSEKEGKFSLKGKTNEVEGGKYLYLHSLVENKILDSALVENGKFEFKTNLPEAPCWVMLHTKDRSEFKELWLEENEMTFNSLESDFRNAEVSGSETMELQEEFRKKVDPSDQNDYYEKQRKFIYRHPENILSVFMLSNNPNTWGMKTAKDMFRNFSEKNQKSFFGKKVARFLKTAKTPETDENYVDFTLPDPEGNPQSLSDFEGKVILLDFWASWCKPCRAQNPELVKLYEKYHSKGFEIVGVSLDYNRTSWLNAIDQDGLEWTQLSDLQRRSRVAEIYGINAIPDNFLIDRKGKIIANKLRGEKLEKKLEEIITGKNLQDPTLSQ